MGPWGHHHRRRERLFEKGELKYLFLAVLRDKPRHGYELMRAIEERSQGRYTASPGAVYPILQMLEDLGLVQAVHQDGRKTYTVTPAGEAFLEEHKALVEEVLRRVDGAFVPPGGEEDWGGLLMELAQFRRIVALAKSRHGLSPGQIAKLTEILRRTRLEVEGLFAEIP